LASRPFHLATRPILPKHDRATLVPDDVERVLADIDADHGDCVVLRHCVLFVFGAPSQLPSLAGLEHGWTIPLPVIPQRRQKTLAALGVQLETLARSSPVLEIFEDVHWGDPTSLEAFGRTVDRIASLRVLLIVTFRPEFEPPWIGQPHVTALTINRLAERDIGAMIDRVIGNKLLPANVRKDIIERTDGIPLFVEEMTKAVLEAGGELEAMQIAAAVPSPALAVPANQACPGARRGLWHLAAPAETRTPRSYRRHNRKAVSRDRRQPAGSAGAALHRG
jgi:hypothetical protein